MQDTETYIHGTAQSEQERLEIQAQLLGGASFLPPLRPGMRILEVGCGTGAIARQLASWIAPGEVVGVDREQEQVRRARELAGEHGVANVRFEVGDVNALDLPDGAFDGAFCRYVLEHVRDPVAAAREMARTVRTGGFVCAYEWDNASFAVHPECPAVRRVWDAVYALQREAGGDAGVAMKLLGIFRRAGLEDPDVSAHAFTFTAAGDRMRLYVGGALEILAQTSEGLLERGLSTRDELCEAAREYATLVEDPDAIVVEVMCCAIGRVRDPDAAGA